MKLKVLRKNKDKLLILLPISQTVPLQPDTPLLFENKLVGKIKETIASVSSPYYLAVPKTEDNLVGKTVEAQLDFRKAAPKH